MIQKSPNLENIAIETSEDYVSFIKYVYDSRNDFGYNQRLGEFLEGCRPRMVKVAQRFSSSYSISHSVEDVVQSFNLKMVRLFRRRRIHVKEGLSLSGYFSKIMMNVARDHVRDGINEKRLKISEFDFSLIPAPEEDSAIVETPNVSHFLRGLNDSQKNLVCAHYGIGREKALTYDELAKHYGVAIGTIKSRLSRAISTLRERVQSIGLTQPL